MSECETAENNSTRPPPPMDLMAGHANDEVLEATAALRDKVLLEAPCDKKAGTCEPSKHSTERER